MICPECQSWMIGHPDPIMVYKNWKKCPCCGYCKIHINVVKKHDTKDTSKTSIDSNQKKDDNN